MRGWAGLRLPRAGQPPQTGRGPRAGSADGLRRQGERTKPRPRGFRRHRRRFLRGGSERRKGPVRRGFPCRSGAARLAPRLCCLRCLRKASHRVFVSSRCLRLLPALSAGAAFSAHVAPPGTKRALARYCSFSAAGAERAERSLALWCPFLSSKPSFCPGHR